jgi:hypothetical protein
MTLDLTVLLSTFINALVTGTAIVISNRLVTRVWDKIEREKKKENKS